MDLTIKLAGGWESYEKTLPPDGFEQLSMMFDYVSQYKNLLRCMIVEETHPVKKDIIRRKIEHIEKILDDNKDMGEYLRAEAYAL